MKRGRRIGRAAGLLLFGQLAGCSAILGIGDLPPVTDGGSSGSSGESNMGSGSSSGESNMGTCNPTSTSAACNECVADDCCSAFATCAGDPDCAGAFQCYSNNSTIAGLCACLAGYGGYRTILDAPFTACYAQDCGPECGVTGTLGVGEPCSASNGCALSECVESNTGEDVCFQFCCSDSDCPSGSSCTAATDIEGQPTQVCAD